VPATAARWRSHWPTLAGCASRLFSRPLPVLQPLPGLARLVKIDAEGHDLQVLLGMESILQKHRPVLIVEASRTGPAASWLNERGYSIRRVGESFNIVAEPLGRP